MNGSVIFVIGISIVYDIDIGGNWKEVIFDYYHWDTIAATNKLPRDEAGKQIWLSAIPEIIV